MYIQLFGLLVNNVRFKLLFCIGFHFEIRIRTLKMRSVFNLREKEINKIPAKAP